MASPETSRGNCLPYVLHLRRFPASQDNKDKNKVLNLIIAHINEQFKAGVWSQSQERKKILGAGTEPEPVTLKCQN